MGRLVSAANTSSHSLQFPSGIPGRRLINTPVPQCCKVALMSTNKPGAGFGPERPTLRPISRMSVVRLHAERPWSPTAAANARRMRQRGLTYSIALLTTGGIAAAVVLGGLDILDILIGTCLGVLSLVGYGAWEYSAHDGMVNWAWHSGRLHVEHGVPPPWIIAEKGKAPSVQVKWTGDARGYGAFAEEDIQAGTFIGSYEGELLGLEEYYTRYPDGVSDYCITVDSEYVVDGATRALDRETFSCCHINHSATRFNVSRRTLPREQTVQMFASKDIRKDEELLLDYGRQFWTNREDMEQP